MILVSYIPQLDTVLYYDYGKYLTKKRRIKITRSFKTWFEKEHATEALRLRRKFEADYHNRLKNTFFNNAIKTELFEITKTGYETDNATTVRIGLTFVDLTPES